MNNFSNSHLPDAQMAHHLAQHSRHPLPSPTDDPNHHNGDPNLAVIDSDHDHELDLENEHSPEHSPEQGDAHAALTSQSLNVDGTPKRPMNAFMIFARRRRPQVSAANHMMRTGEISKILSKEWNAMTMSDKQFYLDQAKKLKENFNSRYPDYVYRRRPNNSRKRRRTGSGSTNTGSVGEEGRDSEEAPDHPREEPDDEYSYASGAAFPHPSSTAQSSSSANTSSSVLPYPERFNQLAWPPLSGGPLTLNTSAAVTRPHASISPSVPSSHSHRPFHSDDISAWRGLPSSVSDSGASFRDLNPTSRPSTNWFSPTTSSSSIHDIATPSSNTGGAGPHNRHRSHSLLSLHTKSKTEPWTPTLSHSSLGHPLSSISTNPSSAGGRPWSASTSSGSSDSGPPHTHAHIPRSVASPPEANTEFEAPTAPFFPSSSLGAQRPSTAGAPSASHGAHLQSSNDYFAQMSVLQHQQHPSQNLHHHQPSHPQNSGNVTHSIQSQNQSNSPPLSASSVVSSNYIPASSTTTATAFSQINLRSVGPPRSHAMYGPNFGLAPGTPPFASTNGIGTSLPLTTSLSYPVHLSLPTHVLPPAHAIAINTTSPGPTSPASTSGLPIGIWDTHHSVKTDVDLGGPPP